MPRIPESNKSRVSNLTSKKRLVEETSIDHESFPYDENRISMTDLNNNFQTLLLKDSFTQTSVPLKNSCSQTDERRGVPSELAHLIEIGKISTLCDVLRNSVDGWNSRSERILSIIIYMLLTRSHVGYRELQVIIAI